MLQAWTLQRVDFSISTQAGVRSLSAGTAKPNERMRKRKKRMNRECLCSQRTLITVKNRQNDVAQQYGQQQKDREGEGEMSIAGRQLARDASINTAHGTKSNMYKALSAQLDENVSTFPSLRNSAAQRSKCILIDRSNPARAVNSKTTMQLHPSSRVVVSST